MLRNSKELLDNLKSQDFTNIFSIKTYVLSTLYTTISHDELSPDLLISLMTAFSTKIDLLNVLTLSSVIYKTIQIAYTNSLKMLALLIDNIYMYVSFGKEVFQLSVGIPMGTNFSRPISIFILGRIYAKTYS